MNVLTVEVTVAQVKRAGGFAETDAYDFAGYISDARPEVKRLLPEDLSDVTEAELSQLVAVKAAMLARLANPRHASESMPLASVSYEQGRGSVNELEQRFSELLMRLFPIEIGGLP